MEIQNNFTSKKINLRILSFNLFLVYIITIFLFSDSPTFSDISKLVFVGFAVVAATYLVSKPIMLDKFHLLLFLNLFWLWFSLFYAIDTSLVIKRSFTFLNLVVMDILLYTILLSRRELEKYIKFIAIGGVLMCIYAVFVYGFSGIKAAMDTGYRLGEGISQENIFGFYAAVAVVLCFFYGIRYKDRKWLFISLIPLFFSLLSGSKKSLLVIFIGVVITIYFDGKNKMIFKKIARGIFFAIIGILLLQLPIFDMVLMRLKDATLFLFGEGVVDKSTMYRKIMIEAGLELFYKNPIIGYGTSNYGYHFQKLTGFHFSYAHNNYVDLLVNNGIIGFVLYYSLLMLNLKKIFKLAKRHDLIAQACFILIALLLVSDITSVTYYNKFSHLIITLSFAFIRLNKREKLLQNKTTELGVKNV